MRLVLVISKTNKVVRLINTDAHNSEHSSERDLSIWTCPSGTNFRLTNWRNCTPNKLNPYRYNRINVHYTDPNGKTITTSYYCIDEVILMDEMKFDKFDSSTIG